MNGYQGQGMQSQGDSQITGDLWNGEVGLSSEVSPPDPNLQAYKFVYINIESKGIQQG